MGMRSRESSTNRLMAFFAGLMAVVYTLLAAAILVDIRDHYDVVHVLNFWGVVWTAFFAILFAVVSVALFLGARWSRVALVAALYCHLVGAVVGAVYSAIDQRAWTSHLLATLSNRLVYIVFLLTIIALLHSESRRRRASRGEAEGDGQATESLDSSVDRTR